MSIAAPTRKDDSQARQDRATARAYAQYAKGNLPELMWTEFRQVRWTVRSKTDGDTLYTVDLFTGPAGVESRCTCQAHAAGAICWHRAICRLAYFEEIDYVHKGRRHHVTAGPSACRGCGQIDVPLELGRWCGPCLAEVLATW